MNIKNLKLLRTWAKKQGKFPKPHSFLYNAFGSISPSVKQTTPQYSRILSRIYRLFGKRYNTNDPQDFFGLPDSVYQSFQTGSLFYCSCCYDWRKNKTRTRQDFLDYIDYLIQWETDRLYRLTLKHQYYPEELWT